LKELLRILWAIARTVCAEFLYRYSLFVRLWACSMMARAASRLTGKAAPVEAPERSA
jgi:hypothetical protein